MSRAASSPARPRTRARRRLASRRWRPRTDAATTIGGGAHRMPSARRTRPPSTSFSLLLFSIYSFPITHHPSPRRRRHLHHHRRRLRAAIAAASRVAARGRGCARRGGVSSSPSSRPTATEPRSPWSVVVRRTREVACEVGSDLDLTRSSSPSPPSFDAEILGNKSIARGGAASGASRRLRCVVTRARGRCARSRGAFRLWWSRLAVRSRATALHDEHAGEGWRSKRGGVRSCGHAVHAYTHARHGRRAATGA